MPMPYTLTRGPILTLLENVLNPVGPAEEAQRDAALDDLRTGVPIDEIIAVRLAALQAVAVPGASLDLRVRDDWIGTTGTSATSPTGTATGYWIGYQGEVDGVLREGLIRAIEVSLGISHDADPGSSCRRWPVQVDWKCPNPYFEVWVTWRRHGEDGGQVNVIIATPPDRSNQLTTRPSQPPPPPSGVDPQPTLAPDDATGSQGMWLITHEAHDPHVVDEVVDVNTGDRVGVVVDDPGGLLGLPFGQWAIPTPSTFWRDTGPVVVVAPPTYAGGADPARSNA